MCHDSDDYGKPAVKLFLIIIIIVVVIFTVIIINRSCVPHELDHVRYRRGQLGHKNYQVAYKTAKSDEQRKSVEKWKAELKRRKDRIDSTQYTEVGEQRECCLQLHAACCLSAVAGFVVGGGACGWSPSAVS